MKKGQTSSVGIAKKTKLRLQRMYFKLKNKEIVVNYDELIILLIDNYEKGGKK